MDLLEALRNIRDNGPKYPTFGICYNVACQFENNLDPDAVAGLEDLFREFGLDNLFPVPCPDGGCPGSAFNTSHYMWVGPYGELRIALLHRCIDHLEAQCTT